MASDSTSYPLSRTPPRNGTTQYPKHVSPAQAIAEAWSKETPESQQYWRVADVRARERYLSSLVWSRPKPVAVSKM
ncbi:hypothetical protein BXZ70DRAFT_912276 [Cristinia sonorae]|uniref:Uncharacterized protein n=1 Tax=Cristinia sonorae TaxID=1940300 RepID=A0A8K0UY72_9AGAR|nr:hypothetical protein BXZ70DRAFT_912276 [Cristinia sonorae]